MRTAFGEASSRANQRLGNAGPASGSGIGPGVTGPLQRLVSASRLARLLSLPCIGLGGLQLVVSAGQVGRVLGCNIWPAPVAGTATGGVLIGLVLPGVAVIVALVVRAMMDSWVKYTMFLPEGTPDRDTAHVAMKQSCGASGKDTSDASSGDGTDGDDDGSDPTP